MYKLLKNSRILNQKLQTIKIIYVYKLNIIICKSIYKNKKQNFEPNFMFF